MRDNPVPDFIRAGGEAAVAAYLAFCDSPGLTPGTRKVYGVRARRFLRWAERLGLALDAITTADLEAYAAEVAAEKSEHEAVIYLSPVRRLFGQFVQAGVLVFDQCPKGQPNGRTATVTIEWPEPSIPLSELKRTVLEIGESD